MAEEKGIQVPPGKVVSRENMQNLNKMTAKKVKSESFSGFLNRAVIQLQCTHDFHPPFCYGNK